MTRSSEVGTEATSDRGVEGGSEHPPARQLSRYALGELAAREVERLRDHLAQCRACSQLVLDLEALNESEVGVTAAEAEAWSERRPAVWEALRAALPEGDAARPEHDTAWPMPDTAGAPRREASASAGRFSLPALAAIVLLSVGLGSLSTILLQGRDGTRPVAGTGLAAPQLFVPSVDLFPPGFSRSGAPPAVRIPAGADIFTVNLHLDDAGHYPDYRLRILDRGGRELWAGEGLRQTATGSFSVALPRSQLPAGFFRLQVWGLGEGTAEELEHFEVEIRYD